MRKVLTANVMSHLTFTFLLTFSLIIPKETFAYSISFGLKGGAGNWEPSSYGAGFTARIFFNSGDHRFGLGEKKTFHNESNATSIHDLFEAFYRYKFVTIGAFYGGHVSNVDNYLEDGLFSKKGLSFQNGGFLGLSYFISPRVELEVEGLYHNWVSSEKKNYISSWLSLSYWWP